MELDIAQLQRALAANPDNPDLLNNMGVALQARGELDAALGYFARALAAQPRHALAARNHHAARESLGLTPRLYTNRFMGYHFKNMPWYMPVPEPDMVDARAASLFDLSEDRYVGIALNANAQLELLRALGTFQHELPFLKAPPAGRYRPDNHQFFETDAAVLYGMMRLKQPARVIEIGSGFSSAMMLDANDANAAEGKGARFTFIDPDLSRLRPLLRPGDGAQAIEGLVQDQPLSLFAELKAGDILFIDSSHVLKIGSDVNHLLATVLPALASGVIVHVHDIFHNFEYPKPWLDAGYPWNEAYTLRHFLMYNSAFSILLFNSWLAHRHGEALFAALPAAQVQWQEKRWVEKSWFGEAAQAEKAWLGGSLWLLKA